MGHTLTGKGGFIQNKGQVPVFPGTGRLKPGRVPGGPPCSDRASTPLVMHCLKVRRVGRLPWNPSLSSFVSDDVDVLLGVPVGAGTSHVSSSTLSLLPYTAVGDFGLGMAVPAPGRMALAVTRVLGGAVFRTWRGGSRNRVLQGYYCEVSGDRALQAALCPGVCMPPGGRLG